MHFLKNKVNLAKKKLPKINFVQNINTLNFDLAKVFFNTFCGVIRREGKDGQKKLLTWQKLLRTDHGQIS